MSNIWQDTTVHVIAIDGASGTGKGTARHGLCQILGFRGLDSGCLYRATAWACALFGLELNDVLAVAEVARNLDIRVDGMTVYMGQIDVTKTLRSTQVGEIASVVSKLPEVREALMELQLKTRQLPGLVADGRDMGEIFQSPNCFRYFLHTNPEEKARRQVKHIEGLGGIANFDAIYASLVERDRVDQNRTHSPLRQHPQAVRVDTTHRTISETLEFILADYRSRI